MRAYDKLNLRFYITQITIAPGLSVWRIVDSSTDLYVRDGKGGMVELSTRTEAQKVRDAMNTRIVTLTTV